jgi:hypothetical protein
METRTVTKVKLFLLWQDEAEEKWLREMAREGLHLCGVAPLVYTFEPGQPRDDVYRLDYMASKDDYEEYKQLFQDAGWELVGEMLNWQYFRRPATADGPDEIYTDPESKVNRHRRVLAYQVIFLPILMTWLLIDFPGPIKVLMAVVTLLWAYSVVRTFGRIRQLQQI